MHRWFLPFRLGRLALASALLGTFIAPVFSAQAQDQCAPLITIDSPSAGTYVQGQTTFSGWAVDQDAPDGVGVSGVQIAADAPLSGSGDGGKLLGTATEVARPDVDAALGVDGSFGFTLTADLSNLPVGPQTFYVTAMTACGADYTPLALDVQPGGMYSAPTVSVAPNLSTTPYGVSSTGYVGNCNPSYPAFNSNYPSNTACSSANFAQCNPSFPNANTEFPSNMPCNGVNYSTYAPSLAACNPGYPFPSASYPTNLPCSSTTTSVSCSPAMPEFGVGYTLAAPCVSNVLAPAASVEAIQTAPGTVSITWNSVPGATNYTVSRSSSGFGSPSMMMVTTNSTSTLASGLTPGFTYVFTVMASNSLTSGAASQSNPVTVLF